MTDQDKAASLVPCPTCDGSRVVHYSSWDDESPCPQCVDNTEPVLLTQGEVDAAVAAILAEAGTTLGRLRAQDRRGRFETEAQRRAWFVIDGLGATGRDNTDSPVSP